VTKLEKTKREQNAASVAKKKGKGQNLPNLMRAGEKMVIPGKSIRKKKTVTLTAKRESGYEVNAGGSVPGGKRGLSHAKKRSAVLGREATLPRHLRSITSVFAC